MLRNGPILLPRRFESCLMQKGISFWDVEIGSHTSCILNYVAGTLIEKIERNEPLVA